MKPFATEQQFASEQVDTKQVATQANTFARDDRPFAPRDNSRTPLDDTSLNEKPWIRAHEKLLPPLELKKSDFSIVAKEAFKGYGIGYLWDKHEAKKEQATAVNSFLNEFEPKQRNSHGLNK